MTARLLVVDDDSVSRLVLRHMLTRLGYRTVEVPDVQSALAALRETPFAGVISDFRLPDGTGLDVLEAMADAGPARPFVLLTGVGEREELHEARVDRVSCYLTKPVATSELAASLRSLRTDDGDAD